MKIGPLFKWFGSKWQSAKHYPPPEHDLIIEPFAGGAGYSLNYADRRVVLWDDDPNLQKLWGWLIDSATESEILAIPINLPVGLDIRQLGMSRGQEMLLKHWQRTNNVGDCWTISPWGNKPGQWTANTRARVADQVGAVKHWEFVHTAEFLDVAATWFVDPPYQYNYKYRAELMPFDYGQLERFIQTINKDSQVTVCEAKCPKTGAVPDYLPFVANHRSVTSRRKTHQSHHSNELIYVRRSYKAREEEAKP